MALSFKQRLMSFEERDASDIDKRLQIPKGFPQKEVVCNALEKSVHIQTSLQEQHSETAIRVTGFGSIWILANSSDLASRSCNPLSSMTNFQVTKICSPLDPNSRPM